MSGYVVRAYVLDYVNAYSLCLCMVDVCTDQSTRRGAIGGDVSTQYDPTSKCGHTVFPSQTRRS